MRFDLPIKQLNLQIIRQIKSPFAYDLTGAMGKRVPGQPAGFRVDPAGNEMPAGFPNTRRVSHYPPGFPIPTGYGETGGQKLAQYRLGKPARPFATRPDISNPAGYGRAEIHRYTGWNRYIHGSVAGLPILRGRCKVVPYAGVSLAAARSSPSDATCR